MLVTYLPWNCPESPYQQKPKRSIRVELQSPRVQYHTCVACYEVIEDNLKENKLIEPINFDEETKPQQSNEIDCCSKSLICSIPKGKHLFDKENSIKSSHATCENCMLSWIKAEIDSNNIFPRCPEYTCNRKLTDVELQNILGNQLWDKLRSMRLAREVDMNPLARWCPNPKCGAVVMKLDLKTKKMECKECDKENGFIFCSDCDAPWTSRHSYICSGESSSIKKWASGKKSLSSRILFSEKISQRCPSCKTRVEKDGGCNHIICWNCQSEWCWLCTKSFKSDHFTDPIDGCPGMQYSTVNVWGKSKSGRVVRKIVGGSLVIGVGVAAVGVAVGVGASCAAAAAPIMAARAGVGHAQLKYREHQQVQRRRSGNNQKLALTPPKLPSKAKGKGRALQ